MSSEDGGKTWTGLNWNSRNLFASAFGDFRTMWIDPQNSDRWILGSDGGVHVSYDGGKTCDHYANIPGGEFYCDHRRHGGPVSDLRRPPGPRLVARPDQRSGRARRAGGLGDGGRQRRDVQPGGPDRQPVGLQHDSVGRALPLRPEDPHPQIDRADARRPASSRSGGTGRRRSRSRRSTAASSTPARRCSSARSTRATIGRRSAPT